jgi:hypothetical protein
LLSKIPVGRRGGGGGIPLNENRSKLGLCSISEIE